VDGVRLAIAGDNADAKHVGEEIIKSVERAVSTMPDWSVDRDNHEGVRVLCGGEHNWFLLRLSLHDPLLVLNVESAEQGGLLTMLKRLRDIISKYASLDCRPMDIRLETTTNA